MSAGLIIVLRPANEKRRYFVTTPLIGWLQTYDQPCVRKRRRLLIYTLWFCIISQLQKTLTRRFCVKKWPSTVLFIFSIVSTVRGTFSKPSLFTRSVIYILHYIHNTKPGDIVITGVLHECDSVPQHGQFDCLFNSLLGLTTKIHQSAVLLTLF